MGRLILSLVVILLHVTLLQRNDVKVPFPEMKFSNVNNIIKKEIWILVML